MKTQQHSDRQVEGLPVQSSGRVGAAPEPKTESRPLIDRQKRQTNRLLPLPDLLALMRAEAPELYALAQIVGRWVWIEFPDRQPPAVTAKVSQLGFHWNNRRQVWQHPCGPVTVEGSPDDPRGKYATGFAADLQPA